MRKIKILAVAPYEGLKELMKNTATEREDIDLHVYIGDLKAGAELALSIQELDNFDVIISRGGTAEMIQEVVHIPVIEIKLTEYDMMRSIKLAQNYSGRFAIVGFPNITRATNMICDLMQCQIDTFTVKSSEQAENVIVDLKMKGYSLLVGDVVTVTKAKNYGLNGILITSGKESINEAFDEAVKLVKALEVSTRRSDLYWNMLNLCNMNIVAYNKERNLIYSNISINEGEITSIQKKLITYIDKVLEEKNIKLLLKSDGYIWSIKGTVVEDLHTNYIAFYFKKLIDVSSPDQDFYKIKNINEDEGLSTINFYRSSRASLDIIERITTFSATRLPILLYGENGTGKDSIAYHIHLKSEVKNQPFFQIDCKDLTDKQISSLLYRENSPLTENEITVYFKNIHNLNEETQVKLVRYIDESFLNKRNRVIYSTEKSFTEMNGGILVDYLIGNSSQNALCLSLPPLRDLKNEIPSLASIYISEFNLELGKQVAGVSTGAMDLLMNFSWELNIHQFVNVLKKLTLITNTTLIQEETTRKILDEEKRFHSQNQIETFQLSGTLDHITSSIIQQVLEEEDMNQSQAAKRLGISRSTLWRKLKV